MVSPLLWMRKKQNKKEKKQESDPLRSARDSGSYLYEAAVISMAAVFSRCFLKLADGGMTGGNDICKIRDKNETLIS